MPLMHEVEVSRIVRHEACIADGERQPPEVTVDVLLWHVFGNGDDQYDTAKVTFRDPPGEDEAETIVCPCGEQVTVYGRDLL